MKSLFYIFSMLLCSLTLSASGTPTRGTAAGGTPALKNREKPSTLKGFHQWKNEKILEATEKLNSTRVQLEKNKPGAPTNRSGTEAALVGPNSLRALENQLRLDLLFLDLAKDLTVTDYFVGYLGRIQGKKEVLKEVAGKMSKEEVSELLSAYSQVLFGPQEAPSQPLLTTKPLHGGIRLGEKQAPNARQEF